MSRVRLYLTFLVWSWLQADAKDILATAAGSKDKDRAPAAYMLYGNGDGGGGPTPDMCESLARLAGCRGLASVTLAAPSAFFRTLEGVSRDLLTWCVGRLWGVRERVGCVFGKRER